MRYTCSATFPTHEFNGSPDPDRVPNRFGEFVCRDHLAQVNQCRRDKGLEPLVEYPDSYGENQ